MLSFESLTSTFFYELNVGKIQLIVYVEVFNIKISIIVLNKVFIFFLFLLLLLLLYLRIIIVIQNRLFIDFNLFFHFVNIYTVFILFFYL